MKSLKDFFQNKTVNSILDVGTGTGDFIAILTDVFPHAKITGVDPNIDSLKEAKQKYPEFDFQEIKNENFKFDDNTFDVASISMALHHLPDIQKTLAEMIRVVKPGGWIIVNELFSDNLNEAQEVHKMFHHFRSTTDRLLGVSHNETFKKDEIIRMVKESGISIQLFFEYQRESNLVAEPGELEKRVDKLKEMLEKIKGKREYDELLPQVEEFRKKATKYGFQPATNVVIIGKIKI